MTAPQVTTRAGGMFDWTDAMTRALGRLDVTEAMTLGAGNVAVTVAVAEGDTGMSVVREVVPTEATNVGATIFGATTRSPTATPSPTNEPLARVNVVVLSAEQDTTRCLDQRLVGPASPASML
jgi:hypothetical protein